MYVETTQRRKCENVPTQNLPKGRNNDDVWRYVAQLGNYFGGAQRRGLQDSEMVMLGG